MEKVGVMERIRKLLDKVFSNDTLRGRVQVEVICAIVAAAGAMAAIISLFSGRYEACVINIVHTLIAALILLMVMRTKRAWLAGVIMAMGMISMYISFLCNGGADGFGPMWFFLVPSVGVLFFGKKWTSVVSLTMISAAIIALWTPLHRYLLYPFSDSFRISYPLLLTVAFLVASTLEYVHSGAQSRLAQSRVQMERLTMIDELTQVENRRCFDERIQEVWKMSARVQRPVSMLIVDIDHFKFYNDYYGHLEGDKVLYKVAQAIRSTVNRGTDLVARWGGEEFVVLLPLTNGKGACLVAQRLVAKIAELAIEHVCTPLASKQLTVSVGIASIQPSNANHYEKLVRLADHSLYVAKRQGRNLVGPLEKE